MPAAPTRPARAQALPAEERRAAIITATIPLLAAHGTGVTTRQIAEAAGIAEGTIFRVFPDKDALLAAVVDHVLDPTTAEADLAALAGIEPFEDRLLGAVEVIRSHATVAWQLLASVGHSHPLRDRAETVRRSTRGLEMLAMIFDPGRDRLRVDAMTAARLLRGLVLAGSHPLLTVDRPLTSQEIVSYFLDGVRLPGDAPCDASDASD